MNYWMILTTSVLLAWVCVVFLAPAALCSISRHRFWRLRDQLADSIIRGEIAQSQTAMAMLQRIEMMIACAPQLSLWKFFVVPAKGPTQWTGMKTEIANADLTEHDRKHLYDYETVFTFQFLRHLVTSSPLGWFAGAVAFFMFTGVVFYCGWSSAKARIVQTFKSKGEDRAIAVLVRLSKRQHVPLDACVS